MTEQLYMATIDGEELLFTPAKLGNFVCLSLGAKHQKLYWNHNLTDLHEVKVVDMDAVVIEGVTDFPSLLDVIQYCLALLAKEVPDSAYIPRLYVLKAQLSTPSEPASDGALSERFWECRCTLGDPHFHQDSLRSDVATPPQSPKGVWIELTEEEIRQLEILGEDLAGTQIGDMILNQVYEAIDELAPPLAEPTEFGAIVEADYDGLNGLIGRRMWVNTNSGWHDSTSFAVGWSSLINPTKEG